MDAYIYKAALYCTDCADDLRQAAPCTQPHRYATIADAECCPQGPYSDGGGEADTPKHCDACGTFLQNPLTDDGVRYVRDALQNPEATDVIARIVWLPFYRAELEAVS